MSIFDAIKQYALILLRESLKQRENENYLTPDTVKNELEQKRKDIETMLEIVNKAVTY